MDRNNSYDSYVRSISSPIPLHTQINTDTKPSCKLMPQKCFLRKKTQDKNADYAYKLGPLLLSSMYAARDYL